MATIDSKKLLPSSTKGGAIEKPKFLVPIKNISTKKISGSDLKPVDKKTETSGSLVVVKKKIITLDNLIQNNLLIDQKERTRKRKEEEKSKVEKRESDIENKVKNNDVKPNLIPSLPGQSIFDKINRFIGFTLLGYLFNKYGELLPKLMEFGSILKPVGEFFEGFAKNLLKGVVNFIEFGYKAYDQSRDFVKQIGGEGAQKTFDEFSKNLNILLNGAISAAMLIASTAPRSPGGAAGGLGASLSKSMSGVVPKPTGGFGAGTAMTPGRYRLPGQSKAGGSFNTQLARKGLTFEQSVAAQQASKKAAEQVAKQGAKQSLKSIAAVPVIGALIGFIIDTVVFREKPSRAAAGAVGSAIGQGIGIALAGGTTFGLGAGVGMFAGGFAGDWIGKALYDTIVGYKQPPTQARAEGGQVTRGGQSTAAPSRRLKTKTRKVPPRIQPQKTQPGKDVGGKLKIEELYGKDQPGKRSALRALRKSSDDVKRMKSINGLAGSMFGAGIDMALGQKPDKNLSRNLGNIFGSVIASAVDMELNNSFGDISKTIAMANGGVVPSREIGKSLSIGERIGSFISRALAVSIENSASKILQNLRNEMNLEGGAPGGAPAGGGEGPGAGPSVSSDSADFWLLSLISLYENANPQGAADVAQSIYNRMGYSGKSARQIILARNQYQPVGQYGSVSDWNKVVDKETALNHIKRFPGNAASAGGLEKVAAALLDKSAQQRAAKFVGNRPDFRSDSYENQYDDMTDDTNRYGQTFGFNRGSAYKGKSLVARSVPSLVKGTVTDEGPPGLRGSVSGPITVVPGIRDQQGRPVMFAKPAAEAFAAMMVDAKAQGNPFRGGDIASTYRTPEQNKRAKGAAKSLHLKGLAADIHGSTGSWIRRNGAKYGWVPYDYPGTHWGHYEFIGGFKKDVKEPPKLFKIEDKNKSSNIFDWNQSSVAPSQTSIVASLNRSGVLKEDTSTMIFNNNAVAILPIEVTA